MQAELDGSAYTSSAGELFALGNRNGGCGMRLVNAGVLSMTIFAVGCGGASTNDATRTNLATPGTAAAPGQVARDGHGNPVATAGRAEPASAAERVREVTIPAGTTL